MAFPLIQEDGLICAVDLSTPWKHSAGSFITQEGHAKPHDK